MSTDAIVGLGAEFRRWDPTANSAAGDWEKISEVTSITPPNKSRDTVDVTDLDVSDGYRQFIGTIRDGGNVSFTMNFTRDGYAKINEDFENDSSQNYEILLPDADNTSFEFEGLVTELPVGEVVVDDVITVDVTIKISGKPTVNSGSGTGS
jgi:predicted secreted protein